MAEQAADKKGKKGADAEKPPEKPQEGQKGKDGEPANDAKPEEPAKDGEVVEATGKVEEVRRFPRQFEFELTMEEICEKAKEAARLGAEIREKTIEMRTQESSYKANRKMLEAQAEAAVAEREVLDDELRLGKVFRHVECTEMKDWDSQKFYTYRSDTGECISEKDFAGNDGQTELFTKPPESKGTGDETATAPAENPGPQNVVDINDPKFKGVDIAAAPDKGNGPTYVDDLGRNLFVSDGGTGKKWSTYYSKGKDAGKDLYDKKSMPPVDSKQLAIDNLREYANSHGFKEVEAEKEPAKK